MRLAVAATPALAFPTLDWIRSSKHDLNLVITRPDKPSGRGKVMRQSEVADWANEHHVRCLKPVRAIELTEVLSEVDLVVTLAYGVILPEEVLNIPRHGFVNVHFSLLPAWRGASPVQRGIENGDVVSGITVFQLDAGMDTGPIYVQEAVGTDPHENSGELLVRLAARTPSCLASALQMIEDGVSPTPQNISGESRARKISKEEARIQWNQDSSMVLRRIRAFTPEPGSWTMWKQMRLQILRAQEIEFTEPLKPGQILAVDGQLIVGCGQGTFLRIDELASAGRRPMSAREWLNGARCQAGDCFD